MIYLLIVVWICSLVGTYKFGKRNTTGVSVPSEPQIRYYFPKSIGRYTKLVKSVNKLHTQNEKREAKFYKSATDRYDQTWLFWSVCETGVVMFKREHNEKYRQQFTWEQFVDMCPAQACLSPYYGSEPMVGVPEAEYTELTRKAAVYDGSVVELNLPDNFLETIHQNV